MTTSRKDPSSFLEIIGASEHYLQHLTCKIPHDALTVISGVSGSGKSSLAFDTIFREGLRRFLATLSAHARGFIGRMKQPACEKFIGLRPTMAIAQRGNQGTARSTVGTLTDVYDAFRVLFSRLGTQQVAPGAEKPPKLSSRLFSFNSPLGACPTCQGLGVEDAIDPALLVDDPRKTTREGALVMTSPKGYIMYSQVTMDVLNQVCAAHGFSVDIPWGQLPDEQRRIILFGSGAIKIPFGKHPLESRLKWTGITARPREEDYYKGIIPVMEAILKRDRNPGILRFVRSRTCNSCMGSRLQPLARSVFFRDRSIVQVSAMPLDALGEWLRGLTFDARERLIVTPILENILPRLDQLSRLGLGHLTLDRPAGSLASGEWQRIRLAMLAFTDLSGLIYVLDEPSLGLHPRDQERLLDLLLHLRDAGNTVIAVEHRRDALLAADWLIDLGPGAGPNGGRLLYEGTTNGLLSLDPSKESPTRDWLQSSISPTCETENYFESATSAPAEKTLCVIGAAENNLKNLDVAFPLQRLVAVTGVSGAGKSTLVHTILGRYLRKKLHSAKEFPGTCRGVSGIEHIDKVITVDQEPIGRTPRSNPSTYTGVFDLIRDLFARQPLAQAKGWNKSRFSWNVSGGRCEACQGSGMQEIGLHLLDPVAVTCEECCGKRYLPETLEVTFEGRSIADILDLPITVALELFSGEIKIKRILQALSDVGLGYLQLGQSCTTLSGGEAQRVKLASELSRPQTGKTLYILDEPATGLHHADIKLLAAILRRLVDAGNTVITVEHHPEFLWSVDWIIDLGPEGGDNGGRLVTAGTPRQVAAHASSYTGIALKRAAQRAKRGSSLNLCGDTPEISLQGVSTHNLRDISLSFPKNRLTVVTGVSGSGKSSLVMGTLLAESHRRYVESLSAYARRFVQQIERPRLRAAHGLSPTIAIAANRSSSNPRSTVGTLSGCLDILRLLFARSGTPFCPRCEQPITEKGCSNGHYQAMPVYSAGMFSFNQVQGACSECHGMGTIARCHEQRLVTHPEHSPLDGAFDGTKTGRFYGERDGRYTATLASVGRDLEIDFSRPWQELSDEARIIALKGCHERMFHVTWKFRRGKRTGEHVLDTNWPGFLNLVEEEFDRKRADHRAEGMSDVMIDLPCPDCHGDRLKPEFRAVRLFGLSLGNLCRTPLDPVLQILRSSQTSPADDRAKAVNSALIAELAPRLEGLIAAGLGYLTLDRSITSLSGGEFRRLLLGSRLGGELSAVTYLLDEPTIGLHPRDTALLIGLLHGLRDLGNTVIVVEHDPDIIRAADHLVEIGPGAGNEGGQLVATGTWPEIQATPESLTARWIGNSAPWPSFIPSVLQMPGIRIRGANRHNLRNLDVDIPLGGLVVITGVSGSGKTTLMEDVLLPSAATGKAIGCASFTCAALPRHIVLVDQNLPGGAENSLIASLTGVLDPMRSLFAKTEEARRLGLSATAFSPFSTAGRCETCKGSGGEHVDLDFLAGVRLVCEECEGTRFRSQILECRFRNHSIAGVLDMTILEAGNLFHDQEKILLHLTPLLKVGLGHLSLGRSTDTLSAGERQRLRLAISLMEFTSSSSCLFVFDEPTTGLHLADVAHLLPLFQELIAGGHSLVVVEHHLEVIRRADWIIDLGPGGGDAGGKLVIAAPPAIVSAHEISATGAALRRQYPRT
ncbi:MAG: excinuclease ABC subunit UvrA [Candidatus Ozemobacteraceae bacterium]